MPGSPRPKSSSSPNLDVQCHQVIDRDVSELFAAGGDLVEGACDSPSAANSVATCDRRSNRTPPPSGSGQSGVYHLALCFELLQLLIDVKSQQAQPAAASQSSAAWQAASAAAFASSATAWAASAPVVAASAASHAGVIIAWASRS